MLAHYFASVESGVRNASIQVVWQLRSALNCTLVDMIGDETANSPEY